MFFYGKNKNGSTTRRIEVNPFWTTECMNGVAGYGLFCAVVVLQDLEEDYKDW